MYKLKEGVELPKEFKIKVNADESKALQEYLFSVGYSWNAGSKVVKNLDRSIIYFMNNFLSFGTAESTFKDYKRPQIHFEDYFYLGFPEKWCIEVTEDNYKELDVWMHRNWKNYRAYSDKWAINNNVDLKKIFVSKSTGPLYSNIESMPNDYTLITTDQFRGKFGNLKVHDVEFVKMGETEAQGTEPSDNEISVTFTSYSFGLDYKGIEKIMNNLKDKAKYYKEKSDRLRKEKFEMSISLNNFSSGVESLTNQVNSFSNHILRQYNEIKRLKNIIAENNVTISKQRQDIEFDGDRIKILEETKRSLKFESDLHNEIIKGLESKIKLLSLR